MNDTNFSYFQTSAGYKLTGKTDDDILLAGGGSIASSNFLLATTAYGTYEPKFAKNLAFNKNFGTTAGTVAEGNHTHSSLLSASGVYVGDINDLLIKKEISFRFAVDTAGSGSTNMFPSTNAASSVLSIGNWSDTAFGSQLGFSNNGNLYLRTKDTHVWSSWSKILTENNNNKVNSSSTSNVTLDNTENYIGYVYDPTLLPPLFGNGDGAIHHQVYDSNTKHQIYGHYNSGQIATRGKSGGVWGAFRVQLDSVNFGTYLNYVTKANVNENIDGEKSFIKRTFIWERLGMKNLAGVEKIIFNSESSRIVVRQPDTSAEISLFTWGKSTDAISYPTIMLPQTDARLAVGCYTDAYNGYNLLIGGSARVAGDVDAGRFRKLGSDNTEILLGGGDIATTEKEVFVDDNGTLRFGFEEFRLSESNNYSVIEPQFTEVQMYSSKGMATDVYGVEVYMLEGQRVQVWNSTKFYSMYIDFQNGSGSVEIPPLSMVQAYCTKDGQIFVSSPVSLM